MAKWQLQLPHPSLCLWGSKTAASKPATLGGNGAWAAGTALEASAEMQRFRPEPWTAPPTLEFPGAPGWASPWKSRDGLYWFFLQMESGGEER